MKNGFVKKYLSENNKFIGSILTICLLIMLVGFSYAFFVYNKTGLYTHTITGGKMSIIYNETTGNNITIANAYPLTNEEALTKGLEFEFTITGYNESEKNIYYSIEMDYGEDVSDKERFLDRDMKLSLYENDEEVFENEIFSNLDNQNVHYGMINQGTSSESPVTNNYKLRIWINDYVIISDTLSDDINTWSYDEWDWLYKNYPEIDDKMYYDDYSSNSLAYYGVSIYTTSEFANRYANFKVNVKADLTYYDIDFITYDANGGSFTPTKTSLTTGRVTSQKPVMEGKGFLGWSSSPTATEIEYKAGDTYKGDGLILYAVYSDTRNVMTDFTPLIDTGLSISEIHFINEKQENIDTRYDASSDQFDLTLNNQGSVKGWVEYDEALDIDILYIGSDGTTYFSEGEGLFYGWSGIKKIDFSNVDTSMVTNMSEMFCYCDGISEYDLSGFNTSNVTDISDMFTGYMSEVKTINLSNFDTSNVTNMSGMFQKCKKLLTLDLSSFDTVNVTDMSDMFKDCDSLVTLDLSNFDTKNVTDMSGLFSSSGGLISIDLSSFNTSNVTDMSGMFAYCMSLNSLDLSNFDTSQVTDMSSMFCAYGGELDLSTFNTSNVTDMYAMFHSLKIKELDLSSFDMSNVISTVRMFEDSILRRIYCNDDWNTGKVESYSYMFDNCVNLVGKVSYNSSKVGITMANPDTGYFTYKNAID